MRILFLAALLFNALPLYAESTLSQRGHLVMERCRDSGSPFQADSCVKEGTGDGGQCTVTSDGRTLTLHSGAWSGSAEIEPPYQFGPDESRHKLDLRGLTRGTVILGLDHATPKQVRIYKNFDRTGKTYLRYDCRDLRRMKARKASAEGLLPSVHAVLKAFAGANEAKACGQALSI
jgi:hypothetical protein